MIIKRSLLLALVCVLIGTATVFANDLWGTFKGFSKVKVQVNTKEVAATNVPGFVVDGTTVLPLRAVSESLDSLVVWNNTTQTVDIVKPNVHMLVAEGITKDYSIRKPFGKVNRGKKVDFSIFTQVDSLTLEGIKCKTVIVDPYGDEVFSTPVDSTTRSSFWLVQPVAGLSFDYSGTYTIRFMIRAEEGNAFATVAEKTIISE
jgi:hypothetical protein